MISKVTPEKALHTSTAQKNVYQYRRPLIYDCIWDRKNVPKKGIRRKGRQLNICLFNLKLKSRNL